MKKMRGIAVVSMSIIFLMTFFASLPNVFAKQDNDNGNGNGKSKAEKVKEIDSFEKSSNGKGDAKMFNENTDAISEGLRGAANKEKENAKQLENEVTKDTNTIQEKDKSIKNAKAIESIAQEVSDSKGATVDAIDKVETRNKFKKFLIGSDYKNLGQLRSSLVQNRNQIKRLTLAIANIDDSDALAAAQAQLVALNQERERIKSVIQANEGGFSILGWVNKFLSGYTGESIDNEEEQDVQVDVLEALSKQAGEDVESDEIESDAEGMTDEGASETIQNGSETTIEINAQ